MNGYFKRGIAAASLLGIFFATGYLICALENDK